MCAKQIRHSQRKLLVSWKRDMKKLPRNNIVQRNRDEKHEREVDTQGIN